MTFDSDDDEEESQQVLCWGSGGEGQLGDGLCGDSLLPRRWSSAEAPVSADIISMDVSGLHTVATVATGDHLLV